MFLHYDGTIPTSLMVQSDGLVTMEKKNTGRWIITYLSLSENLTDEYPQNLYCATCIIPQLILFESISSNFGTENHSPRTWSEQFDMANNMNPPPIEYDTIPKNRAAGQLKSALHASNVEFESIVNVADAWLAEHTANHIGSTKEVQKEAKEFAKKALRPRFRSLFDDGLQDTVWHDEVPYGKLRFAAERKKAKTRIVYGLVLFSQTTVWSRIYGPDERGDYKEGGLIYTHHVIPHQRDPSFKRRY